MAVSKPSQWRRRRDPLWRGDSAAGLARPSPRANRSIVRHVLYLDGAGRETPYHSTSENREVAAQFAGGKGGRVYQTAVGTAEASGVRHISRIELLGLLKGSGHGDAKWHSASEIMTARRYVEEWSEHLLSYGDLADDVDIGALLGKVFS